jgi:short subunit dehydrogenase-like uncharacterized protein
MRRALPIPFVFAAVSLFGADAIVVNVRQSDDTIRAQLLRQTPLGTPATEVYQFLQHRLRHAENTHVTGAPGQPYRSTMSVDLGYYATLASLYTFGPVVVQATWRFDEHDKLRDIEVRRFLTGL